MPALGPVIRVKIKGHVWQPGPPTEEGWFWLEEAAQGCGYHAGIFFVTKVGSQPLYAHARPSFTITPEVVRRHCGPIPEPLELGDVDAQLREKYPPPVTS